MSHELRTPLNSLMILAQQLEENPEHNLTETQVEYASVIHSSGKELLELLNSILDLAKVESGTVAAESDRSRSRSCRPPCSASSGRWPGRRDSATRSTSHPARPGTSSPTTQRLRQILKNLLANAFKFTESGSVHVRIGLADDGWDPEIESLVRGLVGDRPLGQRHRHRHRRGAAARIFEAFAQGDGTTSRLYGGTGLGLSISRELVSLLGGEIGVASAPGEGSTFTVYLPTQGHAVSP